MSTWYRTGTIALTNGSATVTGTGTAWIANASVGEGLVAPDGRIYEVTNIGSDTSITISPAYLGSTASGQAYAIAPLRGRIAQLLSETSSLLSSFATVRDGVGAGLFPNGTVSAPALRAAADQDTGLFFPAANTLALVTGGVERCRLDSSGQFALGTTVPVNRFTVVGSGEFSLGVTARAASTQTQLLNHPVLVLQNTSEAAGNGLGIRFQIADTGSVLRTAGGIGMVSTAKDAGSVTADMYFYMGTSERMRITSAGVVRPGADNTQTLGGASFRWSTVFAGTGTINTSDEREKQWRGPLNAAELRAAKRIAAEIGIYQFLDSIAEKGAANARLHCGVRAQQVFAILEDEGLEWSAYAWCCHDEWEETPPQPAVPEVLDDEGQIVDPARPAQPAIPAGDRYGIRPDQLALWLIAAQEQRLLALEAVA